MGPDRIHPVTETVHDPSDRQPVSLVATHITTDHRKATSAILQHAQVTLALVEQNLLNRREGKVEMQTSQFFGIALNRHPLVKLMHIGF